MPETNNTACKITHGFVNQTFDCKTGKCISQEFIAGDDCEWEKDDEIIDQPENMNYQPYEMKAP